jgi:hypothetical protein
MSKTRDVFGSRTASNPLAYVVRGVERQFKDALSNERFAAIVIYGTSKQGKSSLRRSATGRTTPDTEEKVERRGGFSFNLTEMVWDRWSR